MELELYILLAAQNSPIENTVDVYSLFLNNDTYNNFTGVDHDLFILNIRNA